MATRKTGPVKPPTLDMKPTQKARPANRAAAASRAKSEPTPESQSAKINQQKPDSPTKPLPLIPLASAAGGALAGALIAYLIAASGLWPTSPPPPDPTGPAIAALEQRLASVEGRSFATPDDVSNLAMQLAQRQEQAAATAQINAQAIQELKLTFENLPAPPSEDGATLAKLENLQTDLESSLDSLSTRIDALAAGADPDAANKLADTLATTNQALEVARQSLAALEANTNEKLAALQTRLDATQSQLNDRAATDIETSQTMRLPLAISGMEAALNSGRPFLTELNALAAGQSDNIIAPTLEQAASTGLPSPDTISSGFTAAIPTMLAAAPQNPDASWQDNLLNQAKSLLALRPTGNISGNSPEALVARTEAALALPDFATADRTLKAMPQPMQNAAGDIAQSIALQAEARRFLDQLRTSALSGETAQ